MSTSHTRWPLNSGSISSTPEVIAAANLKGLAAVLFPSIKQEDKMSAQHIFDNTPLGSIIRYSDGAPKPPARFTKKLSNWERSNGSGRLIRKSPDRDVGNYQCPASITVHEGDLGGGGVELIVLHRSFSVDTRLRFEVIETPALGSVRVLAQCSTGTELLHLAANYEAAARWLKQHMHSNAVLEEVMASEPSLQAA
jgi:hypothetical protein